MRSIIDLCEISDTEVDSDESNTSEVSHGIYAGVDLFGLFDMPATKRQIDNADSETPAAKRRGSNVNQPTRRSAKGPAGKSDAKAQLKTASSLETRLTDDSVDKETKLAKLATRKAFMKPLSSECSPPGFPCFDCGNVYIIVDPQNSSYQYRLHKSTLERVSSRFAEILSSPLRQEADLVLKISMTSLGARRFEIGYSLERKTWVLRQTVSFYHFGPSRMPWSFWEPADSHKPFTTWEKPSVLTTAHQSPQGITSPSLSVELASQTSTHIWTAETTPESLNGAIIATEPGILKSSIQADPAKLIDFAVNADCMTAAENYENVHDASSHKITIKQQDSVTMDANQATESSDLLHDIPAAEQRALSTEFDRDIAFPTFLYDMTLAEQRNLSGLGRKRSVETLIDLGSGEDCSANAESVILATEKSDQTATVEQSKVIDNLNISANAAQMEEEAQQPELIEAGDHLDALITGTATEKDTKATADQVQDVAPVREAAAPADLIKPPIELCEAYNNLFLIFYNRVPILATTSLETALQQCELLIDIATRLGALPVIRPYLGNHLVQFGRQLYLSIAKEPLRWLPVSLKLESSPIFREVMVHLVGKHMEPPVVEGIPESVNDLFHAKCSSLSWLRSDVNERLLLSNIIINNQPVSLSGTDLTERNCWFIVQIFRDFCCRQIGAGYADENVALFYRKLSVAGDAYLPINSVYGDLVKLLGPEQIIYTELEVDLAMMKDYAKSVAADVMANDSMLDITEAGIDYLTCTMIEDDELPWAVPNNHSQ